MAQRIQVRCINKRQHNNPHERIVRIGGSNADGTTWSLSETDAIIAIEVGKYSFFVSVSLRTVDVIVATHNGRKYLKTTADGYEPNNLLSLPECPA
jgi:hypothetical protein